MRALKCWLVIVLLSRSVVAQESQSTPSTPSTSSPGSPSSTSLGDAVKPGQLVIVTDASRRETKGIVKEATETLLTLEGQAGRAGQAWQAFTVGDIYTIRKTDPLGNGTGIGAGVGFGVMVAMLVSCGRYQYSEDGGLCTAGAVVFGGLGIGLGAFIGRQVDRAVGEREVYRQPPARAPKLTLAPVWRHAGPGVQLSVSYGGRRRSAALLPER